MLVEFNRYELEHDSFGGFIPVRCWVTDDFKLVLNLFTSDELYDRRNDPVSYTHLELGIVLFLSVVGLKSGGDFIHTLVDEMCIRDSRKTSRRR